MTSVRATGSVPITAASSVLGLRPGPVLRGALAAAAFFAGAFFAAGFAAALAAAFATGAYFAAGVLPAAPLRGGNFDGANSKFTLPASLSQARKALNGRRVRMETNLSSRSVLPLANSLLICSRST